MHVKHTGQRKGSINTIIIAVVIVFVVNIQQAARSNPLPVFTEEEQEIQRAEATCSTPQEQIR